VSGRRIPFSVSPGRLVLLALAAVIVPAPSPVAAEVLDHAAEYDACLTLAKSEPEAGFESALAWQVMGGGDAAQHCAAVALVELGHYPEAAARLEALAETTSRTRPELAPEILAQAGQAWLLAGNHERAYAVQTAALELSPDNVELLVDRGVTLAKAENYGEAVTDLSRALRFVSNRPDILVYRANAYRMLDDRPRALADVEQALMLDPENPEGLLERGNLRRLNGDLDGARQDWVRAAVLAEGQPTGEAAQANLAALDVQIEAE
jgi:tetratricopeptide (TPR) repeat protein